MAHRSSPVFPAAQHAAVSGKTNPTGVTELQPGNAAVAPICQDKPVDNVREVRKTKRLAKSHPCHASTTIRLAFFLDAAERLEGYLEVYQTASKDARAEMRGRLAQCRAEVSRLLAIEYREWALTRQSREMVTTARRLIPDGWSVE
jgi:hypothetical protein